MTVALTRPLTDNRMLRLAGGPDLAVGLGSAAGAVFDAPTMSGLLGSYTGRLNAEYDLLTEDEFFDTLEKRQRIDEMSLGLSLLPPGQAYDEAVQQIEAMQAEVGAITSEATRRALEDGRARTKEELTEEYGDLGLTFDRNMSAEEARLLAEGKRAEIIREAIISRGPTGIFPGAVKFGAGLAAMAVDPLEIASTFIPVVGQAGKAAAVARFGRVGGRTAVGVVEGAVGNALTEPIYYGLSRQAQLDYDMNDALLNIGLGAVFGGGIGTLAGALARRTPDARADAETADMRAPTRLNILPEGEFPGFEGIHVRGPRETAQVALSQFVDDAPVDVRPMMAGTPKRPQTLSEFVSARGGISDADPTFRGELEHAGIPQAVNRGVNNRRSESNLDDMAELAHEAGFISARDTNELVQRLRDERAGTFTFSQADLQAGDEWRAWHEARTDMEAERARLDDIRQGLEEIGVKDATEAEIAAVSRLMAAKGYGVDEAFERVAIQAEDARAEYYARQSGSDATEDPADLRASDEAAQEQGREFDPDEIADLEAMVAQIEQTEGLDADARALIADTDALADYAKAYREAAEAAALCLARTV